MNIHNRQTAAVLDETLCDETVFDELQPGDRIKIEYGKIMNADDNWIETVGTVLRTEHHRRCPKLSDEKATRRIDDLIILETPNGELVVVTIGKATIVRRA